MAIDQLATFFGWCLVVNAVFLGVTALSMVVGGSWISGFHSRLFGLSETSAKAEYFSFLSRYKVLVLVFNLAPFVALKIMQTAAA